MRIRLIRSIGLLAVLFTVSTVIYRVVEGAGWWDAFYMTVITLTTVGYREVWPLSFGGQITTVCILLSGLGILFFIVTDIGRSILEGELAEALGQVRRSRRMERLSDHEIVCGYGRMGRVVVAELRRSDRTVVVVENHPDKVRELIGSGVHVIDGDATSDATLKSAGVARARGLVSCLDDDANNVYVVLTARALSPSLFIVARAVRTGADERLSRAGANRVVNPYRLGGARLAHLLVKPTVVDFLDLSVLPGGAELEMDQVEVTEHCPFTGRSLAEMGLRQRWGIAVVAVQRKSGIEVNPGPETTLARGDLLVVLGNRDQVEAFEAALIGTVPPR